MLVSIGSVKLNLNVIGLNQDRVSQMLGFLREVYGRFSGELFVDVNLYDTISSMELNIISRLRRYGVRISGLGMLSYHDAYSGIPAIFLSWEVSVRYGLGVLRAIAHHEAAHSILHGSLIYYIMPKTRLSMYEAYALFMGVKDFEVTKYLKDIGLGRYQIPLMRHNLQGLKFDDIFDLKVLLQALPLAEDLLRLGILGVDNNLVKIMLELGFKLLKINDTFAKFKVVEDVYIKRIRPLLIQP